MLLFADAVEILIEMHKLFMPGRGMFVRMLLDTRHKSQTAVN